MGYNELVNTINEAPVTWLPALLIHVVRTCVSKNVFTEGGPEKLVQSAKESLK